MKSVHTKTIDTPEITAWLSGLVALGMHYGGQLPLGPEMLGGVLVAVLFPVVMAIVRIVARLMREMPDDVAGFVTLPALAVVFVLAILLAAGHGCGSAYHLAEGGWRLQKSDAGTCLVVHGDGDPEVARICIMDAGPVKLPRSMLDEVCNGPE